MTSNSKSFPSASTAAFPKQVGDIRRTVKGAALLFGIGAALAVTACSADDSAVPPGSSGSNGTSGANGTSGGNGTAGGNGTSGDNGVGGGSGGSNGGTGGMAGSGMGGSGGTGNAGGSGGAGGAGGAGGSAGGGPCDTTPGKAMQFHSKVKDMIAGDIGADGPSGDGPRTLELWAKFIGAESWTAEQSIIELGRPNGANHVWGIDMSGRNGTAGVFGPYTNGVSDNNGNMAPPQLVNTAVDVGWLHLSWAYEGAGGKLEFTVNGNVLPTQVPAPGFMLNLTPGLVLLGASQNFGNEGWDGIMDEVRIWKVYRTPKQVMDNMKVRLKGTEPGLSAYYNFDEATGTDVADVTKTAAKTLKACVAAGGACPSANTAMPTRVASDIMGPFTCAP